MPFSQQPEDLLRVLDPAATRLTYSFRRKPWTPGYRCKASAVAAATLAGINMPDIDDASKYQIVQGAGAANNASPFTYTVQAPMSVPADTNVTTALAYANAVVIIRPSGPAYGNFQAYVAKRLAKGATFTAAGSLTEPTWQQLTATTIAVAFGASGGNYTDVPQGYDVEIIVPGTPAVLKTFAGAGEAVVDVTDFICADTGVVSLNRIFH
jgi:hypothetical protein